MSIYLKKTVSLLVLFFVVVCGYAQVQSLPLTHLASESEAKEYYPWNPDLSQVPNMVLFINPETELIKSRSEMATAMINFRQGSFKIEPLFGRNEAELKKIDSLASSLVGNDLIELKRVQIMGYSSIEGSYSTNNTLAKRRAEALSQYIQKNYNIKPTIVETNFVTEDWDELVNLIQIGTMQHKDEVLAIINSISINDGREKKLMQLGGGKPYREMLVQLYPKLRRVKIEAQYNAPSVPTDQIKEIFESRPALLSLEQMHHIAPIYGDNPVAYQKFYEVVERLYPTDFFANNNLAAIALLNTDVVTARYYLDKIAADPRSAINRATLLYIGGEREASRDEFYRGWDLGYGKRLSDNLFEAALVPAKPVVESTLEPITVAPKTLFPRFAIKTNLLFDLASALNLEVEVPWGKRWSIAGEVIFPWWLLEKDQYCLQTISGNVELRHWLGNRTNRSPLTGWFSGIYTGGGYYDIEWKNKGYQGEYIIPGGISGGFAHKIGKNMRMEYSVGMGYLMNKYREYEPRMGVDGEWHLILKKRGNSTWFGPTKAKVSLVWVINGNEKR